MADVKERDELIQEFLEAADNQKPLPWIEVCGYRYVLEDARITLTRKFEEAYGRCPVTEPLHFKGPFNKKDYQL